MPVVDTPWDGNADRFSSEEQFERSCVLDRRFGGGELAEASATVRCSLPIREPNGDLNRHAVHAAADALRALDGLVEVEAVDQAKQRLCAAYGELSEQVPDFLRSSTPQQNGELSALAREFGVTPGQARHGEMAMRWLADPESPPAAFRDEQVGPGYLGTLHGHFAVFNRWTLIDSLFEGRFMESLAPGAFKKTFQENRAGMRCLWQHGRDPQAGLNPIGPIRELGEDKTGARYEVPILDTTYNRDRLPGLRDNLFGASFRFQVLREDVNVKPARSAHNPDGIEERVIREAKVREFGPVTFPAYEGATAAVRSLNDWWADLDLEMFSRSTPERLSHLLFSLRSEGVQPRQQPRSEPADGRGAAPPQEPQEEREEEPGSPALASRANRLPGAARKLRTSRGVEQPTWRL